MSTTRKRASARRARATRARRRARARRGALKGALSLGGRVARSLRPHELEQRTRDVVGLVLLAIGTYLAFVLYGRLAGGGVAHALANALGWTFGRARVLAPVAVLAAGALLLLRPLLAERRELRDETSPREDLARPEPRVAGLVCLALAVTIALAAGPAGITSAGTGWSSRFLQAHGGIVGEALYALAHRLVQDVGVTILIVGLLLGGLGLLTGTSLGAAVRALARGAVRALAFVRTLGDARPRGDDDAPASEPVAVSLLGGPPEPHDRALIVRATHVEAPPPEERYAARYRSEIGQREVDDEAGKGRAGREAADADEEEIGTTPRPHARERVAADPAREGEGSLQTLGAREGELTPQGRFRESATDDPAFVWRLPDAGALLTRSSGGEARPDTAGQEQTAATLLEALGHFDVRATVIGTVAGPHITRFELRLAPGTKMSKVATLKDDIAYALAATDIRILAPIPGKQAVGVEVPNAKRRIVRLGDVFQDPPADWSPLSVWLGKDVAGKAIGADLAKMPHLLVAGTTGAGKSGAINAMLASILLRASPREVRLVLVDPKQVELNHYESIPHLLTPVITSPRMAANALANLVKEMEQRYGIMSMARTRGLVELNVVRSKRGEAPLPYILCVIDELADLMMVAPTDVEDSIIRLAQKARAVGVHLVLATQSPRVDVITGMIKANVPSRIAFAVSSQTDSRVILDQNGAESLLGQGDMLFSPVGTSRLQRIQGAYIDERQIARLTEHWRRQGEPDLREELLEEVESDAAVRGGDELDPDEDPVLADAITLVAEMQTASTSMLQRRLRLGYTRAGRVIDMLERRGVISGYEGSKPRTVLITEADLPRVLDETGRLAETGMRAKRERLPASAGAERHPSSSALREPAGSASDSEAELLPPLRTARD
jgi:S-DNA-T family DNA segregation ATPase FtsK/SpoIIIE